VAWYLEKNLPNPKKKGLRTPKPQVLRLTIIYLLELSATSQDWEILGFSARARRIIDEAKHYMKSQHKKESTLFPFEFYQLWARYNIGIAYYHQQQYRKAVLEFNQIIWQVSEWEEKRQELFKYYKGSFGKQLLFLPAQIFRAEVQLKLQLAYHALETLNAVTSSGRLSKYKRTRALLIKIQAFQLMGRLDKSWASLTIASKYLSVNKIKGRFDCKFPDRNDINGCDFPRLGERFVDLLIDDYLQWLTIAGTEQKRSK
ncbi:unnamed protein product, partial [marine sediment metagenome]